MAEEGSRKRGRKALDDDALSATASGAPACPVVAQVEAPAPQWEAKAVMPDLQIQDLSSEAYNGRYLVLFFYPKDWTFVCPSEITGFSDRFDDFQALNCDLVGVSTDNEHCHYAWIKTSRKEGGLGGSVRYPLVSDLDHAISRAYGVLLPAGIACRGLFIINDKGIVVHSEKNADAVGRNVDETLRLVKAFQYAAENGVVCPMGWAKAGDATIKPNQTEKLEYFSAK